MKGGMICSGPEHGLQELFDLHTCQIHAIRLQLWWVPFQDIAPLNTCTRACNKRMSHSCRAGHRQAYQHQWQCFPGLTTYTCPHQGVSVFAEAWACSDTQTRTAEVLHDYILKLGPRR